MTSRPLTVTDGYTGRLDGRGTGQRLTEGDARITKISVGEMDNNVYLVESLTDGTPDGHALLVDAANDAPSLVAYLREAAPGLDRVLTTHEHPDHWIGLAETVRELGLTTLASAGDAENIHVPTDVTLAHGDTVTVGGLELDVVGFRGHTPDGIGFVLRTGEGTHLFSGDSLFPGGPGKTPDEAAFGSLMDDLEHRVFDVLDDSVVVHPGHGDDTTLGAERPHLGEWRERGW